uniref:Uncharacterized protein n=1 Tax=Mantoniella tinhauana virus 1 TaxID=3111543 RepID=A0AB38ZMA5_9VIRU
MIYNSPIKGEDGLYFVKALDDSKHKILVQLNKVNIAEVSGEVVMDMTSDVNIEKINTIDEQNLEAANENCQSWFGKKLTDSVIRSAYTNSLKDGQLSADRLDVTRVFDMQQEAIDFDRVEVGKTCDVILEMSGLWFAKKAFGATWNIVQVRVHDDPILDTYPDGYAFVDEE